MPTEGAPRRALSVGGYRRDQMTAIKLSRRLGEQLAVEQPEVAELYRAGRSYPEIAATLRGLIEHARTPRIAAGAVAIAVHALLGREELQQLASEHRRAALKRIGGRAGTEAARAFRQRAVRARIEKHGVRADADRLTRAKGYVPWSAAERALVLDRLLHDPAYRHVGGAEHGKPAYARMADAVNREHHGGRAVRTRLSVQSMSDRARRG